MVRYIKLAIPPGMEDVYNPIEDVAFLKQIGARRTNDVINTVTKSIIGSVYEVKNAETGMAFELWWWSKNSRHYCKIQRKESDTLETKQADRCIVIDTIKYICCCYSNIV